MPEGSASTPIAGATLSEWLHYIELLHGSVIELGLSRVAEVAKRLDVLQPAPLVITVAGTNGKGTTCRALETILLAAGYSVGVYSSPHLIRYTERIRINGEEVAEAQHCQSFMAINNARKSTSLTYFEFSTLSALYLFKQAQVNVAILEVGLGGRLDATNIVASNIAVITSIALDHTDWLGDTRESIGREKAGIFRSNRPAVIGEVAIPDSVIHSAKCLETPLFRCGIEWEYTTEGNYWQWSDRTHTWRGLPMPSIPLANAATALAVLSQTELTITENAIKEGLSAATLPGRFQQIQVAPTVILDVAHNPHAAAYLALKLQAIQAQYKTIHAVVGMLNDKDIKGTLTPILPLVDKWYCGSLEGARGTSADNIAKYVPEADTFVSISLAFEAALSQAHLEDLIIVFGSFHTVAEVLMKLSIRE